MKTVYFDQSSSGMGKANAGRRRVQTRIKVFIRLWLSQVRHKPISSLRSFSCLLAAGGCAPYGALALFWLGHVGFMEQLDAAELWAGGKTSPQFAC
jgi:hypothetical protein